MPDKNTKILYSEKISKLQKKFIEIESLANTIAQSDLLQNLVDTHDDHSKVQANAQIEEEIVLWKKQSTDFRASNNSKVLAPAVPIRENEWEQFAHNIRFLAPTDADIFFSSIPKSTDGMGTLFQNVCRILKKYPSFFSMSVSHKYRGNSQAVNSSGSCSVLFGLDVEALKTNQTVDEMRRNQENKLKVLRFLYQIKCREETDEIKILLQHNKSTIESSEFLVIVFIYSPIIQKIAEPKKILESKSRKKSNMPLEM